MMSISSPAGRRLAEAQDEMDAVTAEPYRYANPERSIQSARRRRDEAAEAVARELMASGFHLMEGD
ncbi:hypothetical protein [Halomonas koreensis]|uniref:Uncharacterized protein n=1 Tax=Halomonas koreensis TaxID=245385 RepID=A0ABU1G629_9GAMM|nr:hypothetical protein [Halomonas koreensis]MDR5867942.1 hypothetical protein [Halomonas koreensis]